jgi:hypothetical protein
VIPGLEARHIPGFRSIDLVRRERDYDVEFMTLMWFDTVRTYGTRPPYGPVSAQIRSPRQKPTGQSDEPAENP